MNWKRWTDHFFPRDEEREPAFREELSQLSAIGLRAIGFIGLFAPILIFASAMLLSPSRPPIYVWRTLALTAIGAVATHLSFKASVRPFARLLGALAGYMIVITLVVTSIAISREFPDEDHHLPGNITLAMLICIAALPLKPLQTLALGLSITASNSVVVFMAPWFSDFPGSDPLHVISNLAVTFICTALTAVIYAQRSSAYRSRQQVLRSFEDLRLAQARLLLSETAASLETLVLLYKKRQGSDETKLAGIFDSLARTALESCQRLKELVARMQRFTHLDRAEEQVADINELLRDTIGLLQSELNQRAEVTLNLKPLPRLKCKPQQLSAVFLHLLRNAIAHLEENGKISVSSVQSGAEIAIQVCDSGQGIAAERLPHLFEPTLTVRGGRVTTSNWGLFTSRSIILEHGGQIRIESTEGKGTTVTVTLAAAEWQ